MPIGITTKNSHTIMVNHINRDFRIIGVTMVTNNTIVTNTTMVTTNTTTLTINLTNTAITVTTKPGHLQTIDPSPPSHSSFALNPSNPPTGGSSCPFLVSKVYPSTSTLHPHSTWNSCQSGVVHSRPSGTAPWLPTRPTPAGCN
jgi:hypothetical protein